MRQRRNRRGAEARPVAVVVDEAARPVAAEADAVGAEGHW